MEATLKRDGYIYEGNSFPVDSNGPWLSKWFMTGETKRRSGSDVRRLRIIDVYGDKCTIVYEVSKQDHSFERFATYDFPLSDLKYNEKKVAAAQDGKKTDFHGSGFSLELSEQKKGSWIILLMFFFPVLTILMEIIIFIPPKEKSALN